MTNPTQLHTRARVANELTRYTNDLEKWGVDCSKLHKLKTKWAEIDQKAKQLGLERLTVDQVAEKRKLEMEISVLLAEIQLKFYQEGTEEFERLRDSILPGFEDMIVNYVSELAHSIHSLYDSVQYAEELGGTLALINKQYSLNGRSFEINPPWVKPKYHGLYQEFVTVLFDRIGTKVVQGENPPTEGDNREWLK